LRSEIHKLIESVWNKEELPHQWEESIVVPIHKKGDKTDCSNYRGMSFLHVARMGEGRNVYRVLVGKPEGKRPLERPRRRWEDGIKMDLRDIGWGCGVDSAGSG
jgi:hypothetical protein